MGRKATKKTAASTKKAVKKAATKKAVTKRARTPPFPAHEGWTTAQFFSFLRSGLRAKFSRWPPKYQVLSNAKRDYHGPNPRQRYEFVCAICKQGHPQTNVEVDHIVPCGTLKTFEDLPGFVERLFCGVDGLRCVCLGCHKEITANARTMDKN